MRLVLSATIAVALSSQGAQAQTALDRVDPAEVQREDVPSAFKQPESAIRVETTKPAPLTQTNASYQVGAIALSGLRVLEPSDFVDIISEFSGRTMNGTEISALADRIAQRARDRGYPFASAWIVPQRLDAGVLFVTVDEGVINRIDLKGTDLTAIRDTLAPLLNGRPVTLAELERRLLLAGDIDGVWVRRSRFERRAGQGVLIVDARRQKVRARALLENDGSKPIGPEQASLYVDISGLLASDDSLLLAYSTTPFEPDELQSIRARYANRINNAGTEVGVAGAISSTNPGAYLANRDIFGRSWQAELNIRHPILRRRAASLWVEGAFESRELRQERRDVVARRDRITALRVGMYALADLAGGRIRGRATLSQGLDALGATPDRDPLASREDASPRFTTLHGWFDWTGSVADRVSVRLSGLGQLSTTPLLISEDVGLGGRRFLRGYNYSERSGDQGVIGSGELRYDLLRPAGLVRRAQLYAFADGGVVGNLEDGRGSGSLASGGGGIRTAVTRTLDLDLQLAFPMTGPRYDTDDMSPRFTFQVRQSFF